MGEGGARAVEEEAQLVELGALRQPQPQRHGLQLADRGHRRDVVGDEQAARRRAAFRQRLRQGRA
jgi:hypothetical protein